MSSIFISYRREDSKAYALALHEGLAAHFGQDNIFWDIDTVEPGADFAERITEAVGSCDALVVVIGPTWLTVTDERGRPRLSKAKDFVRLEIAAALARKVPVVPVLVGGSVLPNTEELPKPLARLTKFQAQELSDGRWQFDVKRLIEGLHKAIGKRPDLPAPPTRPQPPAPAPARPPRPPAPPRPISPEERVGAPGTSKIIRVIAAPRVDIEALGQAVQQWFQSKKFTAQIGVLPDGPVVQAAQPEKWRMALGMSSALNVHLKPSGDQLTVEMWGSKYSDKVAAGAVGVMLGVGAITPIVGAWMQKGLPEKVIQFIQQFVAGAGASTAGTAGAWTEPARPEASDEFDQLRKLGELRDAGILTEEEFTQKKQVILAKLG